MALLFQCEGMGLQSTQPGMLGGWYARNFASTVKPVSEVDGETTPSGTVGVFFKGHEFPWLVITPPRSDLYAGDKSYPIISTDQIEKAYKEMLERGSNPAPIQEDGDGFRHFEIRDPEGNLLQISEEA